MDKRQTLKEALKGHIKEAISKGNIKEGWIENFIDDIFDKAKKSKIKNDPVLKVLHKQLAKETEIFFKAMEKRYKGAENFPEYIKDDLRDVGYPGF